MYWLTRHYLETKQITLLATSNSPSFVTVCTDYMRLFIMIFDTKNNEKIEMIMYHPHQ